jgi:hypothetical protein
MGREWERIKEFISAKGVLSRESIGGDGNFRGVWAVENLIGSRFRAKRR